MIPSDSPDLLDRLKLEIGAARTRATPAVDRGNLVYHGSCPAALNGILVSTFPRRPLVGLAGCPFSGAVDWSRLESTLRRSARRRRGS